jgi:PAS domain S-box-containing protein
MVNRDLSKLELRIKELEAQLAEQESIKLKNEAYLDYHEKIEIITQVLQSSADLDCMLNDLLETMLEVFDCERAWFLYPCNPAAPFWTVPMERTREGFTGAFTEGPVPTSPELASEFQYSLDLGGPVIYDSSSERILPAVVRERFSIKAQISMTLYTKGGGDPWILGLHKCAHEHVWTETEKRLFQDVCGRAADALSTLLHIQRLQESEERFRILVNSIPGVVYAALNDSEWTMRFISEEIENISGFPASDFIENQVRSFNSIIHPEDRAQVWRIVQESVQRDEPFNMDYRIIDAQGEVHWVHERGQQVGSANQENRYLVGAIFDITEQTKLQAQLQQSQRMETVGRLAGGIAHDFNNILAAIIGHSELLLYRMNPASPGYDGIKVINEAGISASRLTSQLLTFSRKQVLQLRVLDANSIVNSIIRLLKRLIGEDIELVTDLETSLWPIKADAGQIEQVIMNLAVNAREAMSAGGKLTIRTINCINRSKLEDYLPDCPDTSFIMLEICDTGHGMDEETKAQVFDPLYTTKEKGTGLGLSIVYSIVNQSGGQIVVESKPGQGTSFKIFLPAIQESLTKEEKPPLLSTADLGGSEMILVVEDDQEVRLLIESILQDKGYRVLVASNGHEALALCKKFSETIDLIVSDVVMPEMSGRKVIEQASQIIPNLKSLYISGYTESVLGDHDDLQSSINLLMKPFSLNSLLQKVRKILDADTPDTH